MRAFQQATVLVLALFFTVIAGSVPAQESSGPSQYWFKVEELNAGLGQAPNIDRETPQAAVESFLFHARGGNYRAAAHLLDLGEIDPARQAERGPALAQRLDEVIKRKVWINWDELPDRPDALDAAASSNDPLAGQPRRSLRLALIDADGRPIPIRLTRVKPADGDPVWLFSSQTVENIPMLHRLYGESQFEKALPEWSKKPVFFGLGVWEVIILPLLLIAAAAVAFLVQRGLKATGQRLRPDFAGRIVYGVAVPVGLMAAAVFAIAVTRGLFVFSVAIETFLQPVVLIVLFGGVLMILVRIIDMVIERTLTNDLAKLEDPANEEMRSFQTNLSAFRRIGIVIAIVFFAGLLLTQVNLMATTGIALMGSAGVLTLILAFAARSALSNIMASLQIAVSKAATIGDSLLFEGQWCYVEKINFTYVQLKTWDNRRLIVPVTYFVSEPFENWTKRDPTMTKVFELRLNHTADVEALRERFFAFIEENENVSDKEDAKVLVVGHDASGMLVRFYAPAPDPTTGWTLHCELREAMLKAITELEMEAREGRRFLPTEREVKVADMAEAAE